MERLYRYQLSFFELEVEYENDEALFFQNPMVFKVSENSPLFVP
jgi:hypothetical protein